MSLQSVLFAIQLMSLSTSDVAAVEVGKSRLISPFKHASLRNTSVRRECTPVHPHAKLGQLELKANSHTNEAPDNKAVLLAR
ncbi:MAG: hypothetical protein ACREBW_06045 [Candidatus Micrarchaeaceae archaeon]